MAAAGSAPMDVDSSSQEEASRHVHMWTPNLGCNLRVDLNTGVPEYHNYLKSASWITRRALRTVGDGGEDVTAYFPHGEKAVTDLLEGQLAFLSHVRLFEENHPGNHILQQNLVWKYEFLRCFLGCLDEAELSSRTSFGSTSSSDVSSAVSMRQSCQLWQLRSGTCPISVITAVKTSKNMSRILRHDDRTVLGKYMEFSLEGFQRTSAKPYDWRPPKFFSFLMANSKGRFNIGVAPVALTFGRFLDWDFHIGTVVKYGPYVFYCNLDYESYLNHGHELYLTDNGVVLSYESIAPMYLTFHYRPPHEKDPGGEAVLSLVLRRTHVRRGGTTHSEGSTRYAYQPGDTVHGKVDAHKSQQQEELNEVLRKARTNPWHLFAHGVLHRTDGSGVAYKSWKLLGNHLVTPWHTLSKEMRTLLGGEYNWASWMSQPLSGYSLHFFLKAFELGKLQGNYLVKLNHKPRVYTGGYKSPYEKYSTRHPGGLPKMMDDISKAATMEFRPLINEIGFRPPSPEDPRERKPKADDPDYSQKLEAHEAFNFERDVYQEISH
eukprot:s10289_g1.t1